MEFSDKLPARGKTFKYKALEFWAQGGIICLEDTANDGDFKTIPLSEFLQRAITLKHIVTKRQYKYVDDRLVDEKFLEDAAKCVREAMNQGDPFDPRVLEHFYKHRRQSYIVGLDGRRVDLHTVGSADVTDQMSKLPPIPVAPDTKPFTPIIS